ncbi:outer membrane beta-barrel protein [Bradyrhizobium sp. NAS96.2]|uniref:outer membrane protein n=1 Tax=Bradyrhizobium sp. NAS96.2 TaxID=1680160 RepID=UPI00093FA813|nr:outer membrane beta-barrel protein [Bradyrhizobium sp. NAS96.2]OKO81893.1 membrane protein [Bradyrhizobium sp. NAS96.2]
MKNLLLLTASIIALNAAAPAFGADLGAQPVFTKAQPPLVLPPAIYDWTGLYIGINGGWASSNNCWDLSAIAPEGCHDASGATVGGQVGYRWQIFNLVYGVEAQGNWANFSGSNVSTAVVPTVSNRTRIDAFGLFTGQIGYAFNNVLLFAKGGAAVTSNSYQISLASTGAEFARSDNLRWGGALGAGLEVSFAPSWSFGVEYDHLFMQDNDIIFPSTGGFSDRIRQDVDLVTVRLNYKFGPGFTR